MATPKIMTHRQLSRMLNTGKCEYKSNVLNSLVCTYMAYSEELSDEPVAGLKIRLFGKDDWIEPYEVVYKSYFED